MTVSVDLIPPSANDLLTTAVDTDEDSRLSTWVIRYWRAEVEGSVATTVAEKKRDIQRFLDYFGTHLRSDQVDDWTKSVSKGFIRWLEIQANGGKGYAPTSINRFIATVRHLANFIEDKRSFQAGNPFQGISDLDVPEPAWNGLNPVQVMRVKAALDQMLMLRSRKSQMPRRDNAIVLCQYNCGMRISELLGLDYDQYDGRHFRNVKRKGKSRAPLIFVPKEAREALADYLEHERGREAGPLFRAASTSRGGGRVSRQYVHGFLKRVEGYVNAKLPPDEHVRLHSHIFRHTSLKETVENAPSEKNGIRMAMKKAGHSEKSGGRYIWRYLQISDEEFEAAQEKMYS